MDQDAKAWPGQVVRRGPTLVPRLAELGGACTRFYAEVDQLLTTDGADPAVAMQTEYRG